MHTHSASRTILLLMFISYLGGMWILENPRTTVIHLHGRFQQLVAMLTVSILYIITYAACVAIASVTNAAVMITNHSQWKHSVSLIITEVYKTHTYLYLFGGETEKPLTLWSNHSRVQARTHDITATIVVHNI